MDQDFDFLRLIGELWRRKWLILLCGVAAGVAGWGLSHLQAKSYNASSDLLFQDTNTYSPERTAATNLELASLTQVLINVKRDLHSPLSIDQLRSRVDVAPQGQADIVTVTAHGPSPSAAVQLANAFANEIVNQRLATAQANDQRQIAALDQQIASAPAKSNFQAALIARRRDLQVTQTLETGGVQIVAPAVTPTSPASPKPVRNGAIATVLGLLIGAVLILTLRRYGRRMSTSELSKLFGVPVLAQIPVAGRREASKHGFQESFHILRVTVGVEARRLRERWRGIGGKSPAKLGCAIAITSSLPGDGKTTVTRQLAEALALADETVLVVDLDLRKPSLGAQFGIPEPTLGIVDVLTGNASIDSVLQDTDTPDLKVICGGSEVDTAVTHASPKRLAGIIALLRRRASIVLLDTAPISLSAETSDVAAIVDGVLVVVDPRVDNPEDLETMRDQLRRVEANLVGVVANRFEVPRKRRNAYGYGYGRGRPDRDSRATPAAPVPAKPLHDSDPQASVASGSAR